MCGERAYGRFHLEASVLSVDSEGRSPDECKDEEG